MMIAADALSIPCSGYGERARVASGKLLLIFGMPAEPELALGYYCGVSRGRTLAAARIGGIDPNPPRRNA